MIRSLANRIFQPWLRPLLVYPERDFLVKRPTLPFAEPADGFVVTTPRQGVHFRAASASNLSEAVVAEIRGGLYAAVRAVLGAHLYFQIRAAGPESWELYALDFVLEPAADDVRDWLSLFTAKFTY